MSVTIYTVYVCCSGNIVVADFVVVFILVMCILLNVN